MEGSSPRGQEEEPRFRLPRSEKRSISRAQSIGGQMGRASRAGPRHGEFGLAQARHGTKLNGPCRGTAR